MRIISGRFRGRRLASPPGQKTRPTPDRVREALFNIIGQNLTDQSFLDLYGGSGAISIEAHSRGADPVVCVENDRAAVTVIRKNIEICGAKVEVMSMDVRVAVRRLTDANRRFDLVFADPPYAESDAEDLSELKAVAGLLAEGGDFVLEHRGSAKEIPIVGLDIFDRRRYGDIGLTFYRTPESAQKG